MNMHTAFDSLINLVTGLGGARDKSTHSRYVFNELQRPELEAAYRSDWIARKVIDIPAQDATRAWRAWQAEDDQIEKLEEFERKFQVQAKVRRAMILARLYGGAALVLGVDGTGDASTELDLERIKLDSFKFLHVVHRHELRCEELEEDVMSPYYAEPKFYERHGIVTGVPTRIHPSRIVRLIGSEVPDRMLSTDGGWGDSILQVVNDAVMAAGSVAAGVAFMVHEAKIDVIKIPGLSKNLTTKEYAGRLINRFAYANQAKGLTNTLMIDSLEEWERIHQKFDTLPDVLKMYFLIASGAADIPATRFLGQSPAGLSSTGESDIRNYYDRIGSDQINYLQPTLSTRADEVIIRSVLGSRPEEIHYRWNPLWQLDDLQKADLWNKKAQTFKVDADLGMISPEALREVRENQLIEDGVYPGLEQALEDFPDEDMEEEPDELALVQTEQERVKLERMKKGQPPIPSDKVPSKLKVVGKDGVEVEDYRENQPRDPAGSPTGGQWSGAGFNTANPGDLTRSKGKLSRDENASVDDYVNDAYQSWNSCLRKSDASACQKRYKGNSDWDQGSLKGMMDVVDRSHFTKDAVVHRGMPKAKGLDADSLRKSIGKSVELKGLISTSRSRETAEGFADGKDQVRMEIYAPKGSRGYEIPKKFGAGEREIVLPHRSRFRVESVIPDYARGTTVVRMRYLDNARKRK